MPLASCERTMWLFNIKLYPRQSRVGHHVTPATRYSSIPLLKMITWRSTDSHKDAKTRGFKRLLSVRNTTCTPLDNHSVTRHDNDPARPSFAYLTNRLSVQNILASLPDMFFLNSLPALACAAGTVTASPMLFSRQRGESPCFNSDDNRW